MIVLLPDRSISRLNETAQCVLNAASHEAKSLLNSRGRESEKDKAGPAINLSSETMLHVDSTLQAADDEPEHIDTDDDDDFGNENDGQPDTNQASSADSNNEENLDEG